MSPGLVTMETWSLGERDVTLVMGSSLPRRTGTTPTLFGTVLLHIASVKPDLTQIARLVEFQKSVINISMGVIYLRILSLNKYFFQMKYKAFYCLWIIHNLTTITIYL